MDNTSTSGVRSLLTLTSLARLSNPSAESTVPEPRPAILADYGSPSATTNTTVVDPAAAADGGLLGETLLEIIRMLEPEMLDEWFDTANQDFINLVHTLITIFRRHDPAEIVRSWGTFVDSWEAGQVRHRLRERLSDFLMQYLFDGPSMLRDSPDLFDEIRLAIYRFDMRRDFARYSTGPLR